MYNDYEGPYKGRKVRICVRVSKSALSDVTCTRADLRLFTTAQIKILIWPNLLNWVKDIMMFVSFQTDREGWMHRWIRKRSPAGNPPDKTQQRARFPANISGLVSFKNSWRDTDGMTTHCTKNAWHSKQIADLIICLQRADLFFEMITMQRKHCREFVYRYFLEQWTLQHGERSAADSVLCLEEM